MKFLAFSAALVGAIIVANGFYHCDKHHPRSFQYTIMAPVGSLLIALSVYLYQRWV